LVKPIHFDYELNIKRSEKQLCYFVGEDLILLRGTGGLGAYNIFNSLNLSIKLIFSLFNKKDEEKDFIAFAGLMADKVFAISMKSKTIKSK